MEDRIAICTVFSLSALIVAFLFWLIYFQEAVVTGINLRFLPATNAMLNFSSAVCVTLAIWCIKNDRKKQHGIYMAGATTFSALFLVGYLIYHHYHGDTKFIRDDFLKWIYFPMLISHIILSIAVVPMILMSLYNAARRKFSNHKSWARYTYPIWLYVSVTGVLVFFFLRFLNY